MTDRNMFEANPTAQEEERQILLPNYVPQYLDPFFIQDFKEGTLIEYQNEGGSNWTIKHFIYNDKETISMFPRAYFDLNTYRVTVINEEQRVVEELIRDHNANTLRIIDTYQKGIDNIWRPIQSSAQNPNDQQL